MKSEGYGLNVVPINTSSLAEKSKISAFELQDQLREKLIPTINSVSMIAQMFEKQTLGPIDLGPYTQYIEALKQCAESQDLFSKEISKFLDNI